MPRLFAGWDDGWDGGALLTGGIEYTGEDRSARKRNSMSDQQMVFTERLKTEVLGWPLQFFLVLTQDEPDGQTVGYLTHAVAEHISHISTYIGMDE